MKRRLALLALLSAQTAIAQSPQLCNEALLDPHFRPPAQMAVGQGPGIGARTVLPLFSEKGMDFYGLDRKKSLTGDPITENAAWILGVFGDENLRQIEARALAQRISNPNLNVDYAVGLKFVLVDMEIANDRQSEKYQAWLKCSKLTSSQSKCPFPAQVPMLWDAAYYQPKECLITSDARGLLFDDPLPGLAYTDRQYKAPAALPFQPSLVQAANIMMERFKAEDGQEKSKSR